MTEYAVFIIASFFAAAGATLAGFGSSMLLIPVALLFMELRTAVFFVACFHLFNNFFKIKLFWKKIDFKTFLRFGVPSILFAFVGAMLISHIPVDTVKRVLASFLIIFSVYSLARPKFKIRKTKATAIIGGSLSGFLAGLIGLGGAIRSTFLVAFNLPKEIYIATSAAIAFVIDLTRIPIYVFKRISQSEPYYILLPLLVISAYSGVRVGKFLLGKIDQEFFRKIVLVALFLAGIKIFLS